MSRVIRRYSAVAIIFIGVAGHAVADRCIVGKKADDAVNGAAVGVRIQIEKLLCI